MDNGEYSGSSRKRPCPDVATSLRPILKIEPVDSDWGQQACTYVQRSFESGSRRGVVKCGHCKTRRALVCCMEEACVVYAESKWRMTTMLVCSQCDGTIHNNPVMSEHLRTPLLIRGFTYHDYVTQSEEETTPAHVADKEHDAETAPGVLDSSIVISTNYDDLSSDAEGDDSVMAHQVNLNGSVDINSFDLEEIYPSPCISVQGKSSLRQSVSLSKIDAVHQRYAHVLQYHLAKRCTLTETFRFTNVARQTLLDAVALAELKIVDPERYDGFMELVAQKKVPSRIADMERECRRIIKENCKDKLNSLRGTKLLPLKLCVYN